MRRCPCVLLCFILFGGKAALAEEPSREELLAEIRALHARVATLEAQRQPPPPTTSEVDRTKENVLRDADERSQPLANVTAGHDEDGFFLRSGSGDFTLRPVLQFQLRGVSTHRQDDGTGNSDTQSGFEVRRLEFSVEGNAFTPKLTYEFKWVTERDGGELVAEDAWLNYQFADRWGLLFGQFRDPVFHEELVSSKYLLAADRSLANAVLGRPTGFVQGVSVVYGDKASALHSAVAVHDGAESINTPFIDSPGGVDAAEHFGVAGRAEYKLFGDWKNYKDFTARTTKTDLLVIGTAADWTQADGLDVIFSTVDAQWKTPRGFSLYGALLGNFFDIRDGSDADHFDWGGVVQAAQMLTAQWEAFGRYDLLRLEGDGGGDTFHEITFGVNRYLGKGGRFGHAAKFTLDLSYLPEGSPSDQTGIGALASEDDQWVFRVQFQLVL
jgi:hypothetical protein